MSVLNIPGAISSALSSLSAHHGGHKKGMHGAAENSALNSATSSTDDAEPSGSTQSLFGTLLDSVEQVVGIQSPASATSANGVNPTAASAHNSTFSPAAMITAARSAIQKV